MESSLRQQQIVDELETWFAAAGRDYPWRRTRDPYAILVAEVMLQQTQIATVLERRYYERWLEEFPHFQALAAASEDAILKAWEGLGYYRRARNLQKLAQAIVAHHAGEMPRDYAEILALPGVGPYTAGAVSAFAFDKAVPIVDGNVARVLARLCNDATPIDGTAGQKRLWQRADALVKLAKSPRVLNSALMELGQTICRNGQPNCLLCPLRGACAADDPARLPVKARKTSITEVTEHVILARANGAVLLEQETGKRRTGLWKLPVLPPDLPELPLLLTTQYGITRYRVTLHVHMLAVAGKPAENQRLVPEAELSAIAMPSPYRRALAAALKCC